MSKTAALGVSGKDAKKTSEPANGVVKRIAERNAALKARAPNIEDYTNGQHVRVSLPPSVAATVVHVAFGANCEAKDWQSVTCTMQELADVVLSDFERGPKDGKAILQGMLTQPKNCSRTIANVLRNTLAILDVDNGMQMQEARDILETRGLFGVVWHSPSNGKPETQVLDDDLRKWLKSEREGEKRATAGSQELVEQVRAYLIAKKKYKSRVFDADCSTRIGPGDKGETIFLTHAPMERFRILMVLKEPFEFYGSEDGQKAQVALWRAFYAKLSESLGIASDPSCCDPCRLQYTPRIASGADANNFKIEVVSCEGKIDVAAVLETGATGANEYSADNSAANEHSDDPLSAAVARLAASDGDKWQPATPGLMAWARVHASDLEADDLYAHYGHEDRGPARGGAGTHRPCPHEGEHSPVAGGGVDKGHYVVNASANDGKGFDIYDNHATCQTACSEATGKPNDRLWHLDRFCLAHGIGVDELLEFCPNREDNEAGAAERDRATRDGLPFGFMLADGYVCERTASNDDDDADLLRVCPSIAIIGEASDEHSDGWSKVFAFTDREGVTKELTIGNGELYGKADELCRKFADAGLAIEISTKAKNAFVRLLHRFASSRRFCHVLKPGWQSNGVFVPPVGEAVKPEGVAAGVEFYWKSRPSDFTAKPGGTLEGWRNAADAVMTTRTPQIGAGILFGAIGPLIHCCGLDPHGMFAGGATSSGKSSFGIAQVSVWSDTAVDKGLRVNARATANALEGAFEMSNGTTLCIDDLQNGGHELAQDAVYMGANGTGRGRMNKDTSIRDKKRWSGNSYYLNAELSQAQLLADARRKSEVAGAYARQGTLDMATAPLLAEPAEFKALMRGFAANYAWAGPALIAHMQRQGWHKDATALRERVRTAGEALHAGKALTSAQARSVQVYALMQVAGDLMQEAGVLGGGVDVSGVVSWAFANHCGNATFEKLAPGDNAVAALEAWVATSGDIYRLSDEPLPGRTIWAWRGDDGTLYLPVTTLEKVPGIGTTPKTAIEALKKSGRVVANGDKYTFERVRTGRVTTDKGVNGGYVRHYRIKGMFAERDSGAMDAAERLREDTKTN